MSDFTQENKPEKHRGAETEKKKTKKEICK